MLVHISEMTDHSRVSKRGEACNRLRGLADGHFLHGANTDGPTIRSMMPTSGDIDSGELYGSFLNILELGHVAIFTSRAKVYR